MFTGIVDHFGHVLSVERKPKSITLSIATEFSDLSMGESIAVDGVCLTVTERTEKGFLCDLSPETLGLTIAENYHEGTLVNLERSLRISDRLGGHFVTGHVDRKCYVSEMKEETDFIKFSFDGFERSEMRFLVKKGSVGLNGVSLTINEVNETGFEIMVIPHTLEITNFSELKEGTEVNVEFDWMTKLIINEVQSMRTLVEEKHV